MKQTCQPLLFSESWLKHCRREKSLENGFRISWANNRRQLARGSQKNCCGATRQQVSRFEQNCCHRWDMDTRFWTTAEISVLSVEACKFAPPEKNVAANNRKLSSRWVWLMTRMEWWQQSASGVHCNSGILQKVSARCFASKDSPEKSAMFAAGVLIFHHNARPHTSGAVSEILEKYGLQVLPHPPYSPDMSPTDFACSQNWRNHSVGNASEAFRRCLMRWLE